MEEKWKPDENFLDFLLKRFKEDGMDLDELLFGCSSGAYSLNSMLDEMREGNF